MKCLFSQKVKNSVSLFNVSGNRYLLKQIGNFFLQSSHYHTGSYPYRLQLAVIPDSVKGECLYETAVYGNGLQQAQHNVGMTGYNVKQLRQVQKQAVARLQQLGVHVHASQTAHLQPLKAAIYSLSVILPKQLLVDFYDSILLLNVTDSYGRFVNSIENKDLVKDLLKQKSYEEHYKTILKTALPGIFVPADSIYKANDFLLLGAAKNYAAVARYPNEASQRIVESAHTCWQLLSQGQYPLLMTQPFEGVANIKMLPLTFTINDERYNLALGYISTRSEKSCIKELNMYLKRLGENQLYVLYLEPHIKQNPTYYHQDCSLNFVSDSPQYLDVKFSHKSLVNTETLFEHYKPNGVVFVAKSSLNAISMSYLKLAFQHVVELDISKDPLIANLVVTKTTTDTVMLVSDKLSKSDQQHIESLGIVVNKFPNLSYGGGGSWQCMSNASAQQEPLTSKQWFDFSRSINMKIPDLLFEAVCDFEFNN